MSKNKKLKKNKDKVSYTSPEAMELILCGKMEKYFKLVSYARKGDPDHPMWKDCPEHIKQGAFNTLAKTEEMYPEEVDEIKDPCSGSWAHGFNSGMLAAFRYIATAHKEVTFKEDGEKFTFGGLDDAEAEFPMLDT